MVRRTYTLLFAVCTLLFATHAYAVSVTLKVVDQNANEIPLSTVTVSGFGTNNTGSTLELPNGSYSGNIHPGFNGQVAGNASALSRSVSFTVDASTTTIDFEWITSTFAVDVVDQNGLPIPGSLTYLSGFTNEVTGGGTTTLPITDEGVYPSMSGELTSGFIVRPAPGLNNGAVAGYYSRLHRVETMEVGVAQPDVDFEWITSTFAMDVVDQSGTSLSGSLVYWSGFAESVNGGGLVTLPITDETVYPTMGGELSAGYVVRPAPSLNNGTAAGYYSRLHRVETMEVAEAQADVDFEWITSTFAIDVVDQNGDPIPGSVIYLFGFGGDVAGGSLVSLAITDESVYPSMSGEFIDGYFLRPAPGLNNGAVAGYYGRLHRSEVLEVTASTGNTDFEWLQMECHISVVDASEGAIAGSYISLPNGGGTPANGELLALPITDESVYPSMNSVGEFISGYPIVLFPAGSSAGSATFEVTGALEFDPAFVNLGGTDYGLRCGPPQVALHLQDQGGVDIPNSQILIYDGGTLLGQYTTGDVAGIDPGTYTFRLLPGVNGSYTNPNNLTRDETETVTSTTTSLEFEWDMVSTTLLLRDQYGDLVPGAGFDAWQFYAWIPDGDYVTLPSTDESKYPAMSGGWVNGIPFKIRPAINGQMLHQIHLIRGEDLASETAEIFLGMPPIEREWIYVATTANVVDQNSDLIPGGGFDVTQHQQWIPSGTPLYLPITDESVYPSMSGDWVSGLPFKVRPGINGTMVHQYDLIRGEDLISIKEEIYAGMSDIQFEWIVDYCPIFLVDANEQIIPCSRVALRGGAGNGYGAEASNGGILPLPITDESVYPSLVGNYKDGYQIELFPDGVSAGIATFEVTSALTFDPPFVTLGGEQFGLRCGLDDGSISSPAAFTGNERVLDFEGFTDGEPITTQYAGDGVTFSLMGGGAPQIATDGAPREYGPSGDACLDNIVAAPGPVLVIDFDCPVERVGFEIRNAPADDLRLTLICANDGVVLAERCFDTDLSFQFVGMEAAEFDQLTINVSGGASGFFRMDNLYFECATPPVGSVAGQVVADCPGLGTPLLGVRVDAYELGSGDLVGSAVTDESGVYQIDSLLTADYTMTIVTPLGYTAATDEIVTTVAGGDTATADFALSCVSVNADPRTIGYWKHQVGVATGGKGHAQVDGTTLCAYLDLIEAHFNSNAINQVIVYEPPASGLCSDKLEVAKTLLNLKGNVGMTARARQQLTALLLNVAAANISLTQVVSTDGATLSQAITHSDHLIDDPSGDHETAKTICDLINNNQEVPAGVIPLETEDIAYKQSGQVPVSFSLNQNYPNPFNAGTVIQYTLDHESDVRLAVYDILGRTITTLVNERQAVGQHSVSWNGLDATGQRVASGMYFYRLNSGSNVEARKMVLLK